MEYAKHDNAKSALPRRERGERSVPHGSPKRPTTADAEPRGRSAFIGNLPWDVVNEAVLSETFQAPPFDVEER